MKLSQLRSALRKSSYYNHYSQISVVVIGIFMILLSNVIIFPVIMRPEGIAENNIELTPEKAAIPADGTSRTLIYAEVINTTLEDKSGIEIIFGIEPGIDAFLEFNFAVTNTTGWAITVLVAGIDAGSAIVTAETPEAAYLSGWCEVELVDTKTVDYHASPPNIPADGESFTTLIVEIRDHMGPLSDIRVNFGTGIGWFDIEHTVQSDERFTNEDGVAFIHLYSTNDPDTAIVNINVFEKDHTLLVGFIRVPESVTIVETNMKTELLANHNDWAVFRVSVKDASGSPVIDSFVDMWSTLGILHRDQFHTNGAGELIAELQSTFDIGLCEVHVVAGEVHEIFYLNFVTIAKDIKIIAERDWVNTLPIPDLDGVLVHALLFDERGERIYQSNVPVNFERELDGNEEWIPMGTVSTNDEGIATIWISFKGVGKGQPGYAKIMAFFVTSDIFYDDVVEVQYMESNGEPSMLEIGMERNELVADGVSVCEAWVTVLDMTYVPVTGGGFPPTVKFTFDNAEIVAFNPSDGIVPVDFEVTGKAVIQVKSTYELGPDDEPKVFNMIFAEYEGVNPVSIDFVLINFNRHDPFVDLMSDGGLRAGGGLADSEVDGIAPNNEDGTVVTITGEAVLDIMFTVPNYNEKDRTYNWFYQISPEFPPIFLNITGKTYQSFMEGGLTIVAETTDYLGVEPYPVIVHYTGVLAVLTIDGKYIEIFGDFHVDAELGQIFKEGEDPGILQVRTGYAVSVITDGRCANIDQSDLVDKEGLILGEGDGAVYQNGTDRIFTWDDFSGVITAYNIYSYGSADDIDLDNPNATVGSGVNAWAESMDHDYQPETGIDDKYNERYFIVAGLDENGTEYFTRGSSFINESDIGGGSVRMTESGQQSSRFSLRGKIAASESYILVSVNGNLNRTLIGNQWNLVSIPFNADLNASSLADEVGAECEVVAERDPDTGEYELFMVDWDDPADAFTIKQTAAYYVWVNNDVNITMAGSISYRYFTENSTYRLLTVIDVDLRKTAWNLLSYPSFFHESVTEVFSEYTLSDGEVYQICILNDDSEFVYYIIDPAYPMEEQFDIVPGEGYYIWIIDATADVTWTAK